MCMKPGDFFAVETDAKSILVDLTPSGLRIEMDAGRPEIDDHPAVAVALSVAAESTLVADRFPRLASTRSPCTVTMAQTTSVLHT